MKITITMSPTEYKGYFSGNPEETVEDVEGYIRDAVYDNIVDLLYTGKGAPIIIEEDL